MTRLSPRDSALRELDTTVLLDLLKAARQRGYAASVLELEIELSARGILGDAAVEPAFPLSFLDSAGARCAVARKRLRESVEQQSIDAFHDNLWNLDPANFAYAWVLARKFEKVGLCAEALIHIAYCIASHFKGPDEAARFIAAKTEDKWPHEIIQALEEQFGRLIDQALEVQNA